MHCTQHIQIDETDQMRSFVLLNLPGSMHLYYIIRVRVLGHIGNSIMHRSFWRLPWFILQCIDHIYGDDIASLKMLEGRLVAHSRYHTVSTIHIIVTQLTSNHIVDGLV